MKRLLPVLVLMSCGSPEPAEPEFRRIVSLVPSITEMLYTVGAEDRLIGVTTYCLYPPEAQKKEKIGSIKVNYEKVLELHPDVVLTRSSMTRTATKALKEMGLNVVTIDAESFEEIAEELRRLGRLTGQGNKGEKAANAILDRVRKVEETVKDRPPPTVYLEMTPDPIGTAGPDSFSGDVLRRAGGRNILGDRGQPWVQVSWELVVEKDPEVILIAHKFRDRVESRPGWKELRAVKSGRVHFVPKEEFIYPTTRLVLGLERAAKLFHETD